VNLTRLLAVTLFLSAFLLFCCQPMVGKMVLPLLGGAASVWTTCVLFFQVMLLAGYLYAHLLGKLSNLRHQTVVHLGLMAAALAFLPIRFGSSALPDAASDPVAWQLLQLARSVAVPFFVISTTAPLLQSWFTRTTDPAARDPYFLYAASNVGSLLALILYPFVFEPAFGVATQSGWWTAGYGLLVVLFLVLAAMFWRAPLQAAVKESAPPPKSRTRAYWLAASFVPSALMLAVTTHVQVNLASVPFLWTLPLAIYLVTFILAFGSALRVSWQGISRVAPFLLVLLFPIFAAGPVLKTTLYLGLLLAHLILLFVGAMLCHAALAESRPHPARLTEYFAWIAFGGVLGGLFAAILAPMVFSTVLEYPLLAATLAFFRAPIDSRRSAADWAFPIFLGLALVAAWLVCLWLGFEITVEIAGAVIGNVALAILIFAFNRRRWFFAGELAAAILLYAMILAPAFERGSRMYVARNFFGVKKVLYEVNGNQRKLLHGDTMHGLEGLDLARAGKPLSYYFPDAPLGNVMEMMQDRPAQQIGVVGLGSGTVAAYTLPKRHITFFEIDPQVDFIARRFFSFLPRCADRCDVVLGDGRLSIQNRPDGTFDLLILDAFNSDSIPTHLLSREAMAIYKTKLKPDGAILIHVSNRYLKIQELVSALVVDARLPSLVRSDDELGESGKARSIFIIAALNAESIAPLKERWQWIEVFRPEGFAPWTDDYSNLLGLLRWR
jgi:SAM-dependent methyltransferase